MVYQSYSTHKQLSEEENKKIVGRQAERGAASVDATRQKELPCISLSATDEVESITHKQRAHN